MLPCDPSPYRTIAAALRDARDSRPLPTLAQQRAQRVRDRQSLDSYVARQRASHDAQADAQARVDAAIAGRFRDTHNDYATSHPHVAPGFTTKR